MEHPIKMECLGCIFSSTHSSNCRGLVERSVEAKLLLLAALSGEHLFLLGPPGVDKNFEGRMLLEKKSRKRGETTYWYQQRWIWSQ